MTDPPTVRDILAEQHGGISRAGLLAWCRLRIDPAMTEAQLGAELERLAGEIESDAGFLRLRTAGETATTAPAWVASPAWPATAGDAAQPSSEGAAADAGVPFAWRPPGLESAGMSGQTPIAGWEAPDGGMSRRSRLAILVGGTIAAIVFVAVAMAIGDSVPDSTASSMVPGATAGSPVPGATMIDAYDLAVGDCVVVPEDDFNTIEKRPCGAPHDAEVYLVEDMRTGPGATFPGQDGFGTFVDERCIPAFQAYTGSAYDEQSVLDVSWIAPTEDGWSQGDREMVCVAMPAGDGTLDRSWRDGHP